MDLSDKQWNILAPLIPNRRRSDGKDAPDETPERYLNSILWIQGRLRWMRTGAQWADLPEGHPPYQTCHRRFREWIKMVGKVPTPSREGADAASEREPTVAAHTYRKHDPRWLNPIRCNLTL